MKVQPNIQDLAAIGSICRICGRVPTDGNPLTTEHLIPLALGGTAVKKFSCEGCAGVTGRVEGIVLRGAFHGFRLSKKIKRRKKTAPPKTLPLFAIDGDESSRLDVPIEDYPTTLILPRYEGPAILRSGRLEPGPMHPWVRITPSEAIAFQEKYTVTSFATTKLSSLCFARMICKIGHCLAVDCFGFTFRPYLQNFILDDRGHDFLSYLGTIDNDGEVDESEPIRHDWDFSYGMLGDTKLLICKLTLFANYYAPSYVVVIGEMGGDFFHDPRHSAPKIDIPLHLRADEIRAEFSLSDHGPH